MSLLTRLHAVMLPNKPDTTKPLEMKRWIDALYIQLERLKSTFTGAAINETIINDTGLGLPDVPDKTKTYVIIWNCATQKVEWRYDGIDCGGGGGGGSDASSGS